MIVESIVYAVDDDPGVCSLVRHFCEAPGREILVYSSAEEFQSEYDDSGDTPRCVLLDIDLPGMDGLELHQRLIESQALAPVIFLTGAGEIQSAVKSIQLGALDYLEKPLESARLLATVERGLALDVQLRADRRRRQELEEKLDSLSKRERETFELLRQCKTNKQIAASLGVDFTTAARHSASIFRKFGVANPLEFMSVVHELDRMGGLVEEAARR